MNAVTNVIARLTPPPFVNPVDYDGLEFKWRFLAFRPACKYSPALLKLPNNHLLQTFKWRCIS